MCGIIGYTGEKPALKILINGLSKLEYRGYDSAGIALVGDKKITITKSRGKLENLIKKIGEKEYSSTLGIGHTRWATHGEPSDVNAHPHFNMDKTISVVHNGIIENYLSLKEELIKKGYIFRSETDSEVIVHLLDLYNENDFLLTIKKTIERLDGSYALGIVNSNYPNTLFAVRNESPLVVGISKAESFIASDVPAILEYTNSVCYLENKEIVKLEGSNTTFYDCNLNEIKHKISTIDWNIDAATKMGYKHFMLKEMMEQPKVIGDTIKVHLKKGLPDIDLNFNLSKISKIYVVGCGTAYHAGLNAKYMIEKMLKINTEVEIASEFRYKEPLIDSNTLVIIISQSGETADTLAALRLSKQNGAKVVSIVNVVGSSIARESDNVIYTWAGPEIAVASTKAFTTQLLIIYLLIIKMALDLHSITKDEAQYYITELKMIPNKIASILDKKDDVKNLAKLFYKNNNAYYLGRGLDYYTVLEGALKLKEISYIHAEAYAAGELKHGAIALIEQDTLVVALCTNDNLEAKMISNIKEVITRGAKTIILANHDIGIGDYKILLPEIHPYFKTILTIIPLQLFAYYMADYKKCDVDKPKNLAKSVTVE
ncbi:MAG: glutamine--fructose-6-phosphate transaminase (isomerizing) [Bacilli bacterium]|nr:glutamine--fructose-6-phosphate transaminase (isomerizing) [Bacilli bacterium]MDD4053929.1 glutamine--fructose-6-phosphate transaminase (isomerizing) [Bacilli bacterium]MDD4411688.1 glutamine--fructose-6-phosphate transaminase (isomerizing) [Bacilli bacterium]